MEEILNKAVKKGENSALIAILLWVCAFIGALTIKAFFQFIGWVFRKQLLDERSVIQTFLFFLRRKEKSK